jgi:hypothetical protein
VLRVNPALGLAKLGPFLQVPFSGGKSTIQDDGYEGAAYTLIINWDNTNFRQKCKTRTILI